MKNLTTKKLILAGIVCENTKFSKQQKIELLNFIKESNEDDLKELTIVQEGVWRSVLGIMVLGPLWILYRAIRASVQDKSRKCGTFKIGSEREACLLQATIWEVDQTIKLLDKANKDCSKFHDPKKCKNDVLAALAKERNKKSKAEDKLHKLLIKGKGVARGSEISKRPSIDVQGTGSGSAAGF
jgi:hypothetical protein